MSEQGEQTEVTLDIHDSKLGVTIQPQVKSQGDEENGEIDEAQAG